MELKTIIRVHGEISSKYVDSMSLPVIMGASKIIDNNQDAQINELMKQGWTVISMDWEITRDGVLFDFIYLARDAGENDTIGIGHGLTDDDDLGGLFRGL